MIEIAPEVGAMLYIGIFLLLLGLIWWHDSKKQSKKRLFSNELQDRIQCEFCGHSFKTESLFTLIRCTLCKSLIKKK